MPDDFADFQLPVELRRELLECATAKQISYEWRSLGIL